MEKEEPKENKNQENQKHYAQIENEPHFSYTFINNNSIVIDYLNNS